MAHSSVLILVLLAAAVPSQQQQDDRSAIVVTGQRIADLEAALAACIEANCPPDKEIDTALALAEQRFVDGDYDGARESLRASIRRNRDFAAAYPRPVAGLLRADARVWEHSGRLSVSRMRYMDVRDVLRKHVGEDDTEALAAQLDVGDALLRDSRPQAAMDAYHKAEEIARAAGHRRVEGFAMLRQASLEVQLTRAPHFGMATSERLDSVERLIASTDPQIEPFRTAAEILKLRLRARLDEPGAVDALIERANRTSDAQAQLIYAPSLELDPLNSIDERHPNRFATEGNWADFGFSIAPDGRVFDVELLRSGPALEGEWTGRVAQALAGRRYQGRAADAAAVDSYRIERFTYTADLVKGPANLRIRSPKGHVVRTDLTATP